MAKWINIGPYQDMKFKKTLEDNEKILQVPEKEKKGSHTRDDESQRFQPSH